MELIIDRNAAYIMVIAGLLLIGFGAAALLNMTEPQALAPIIKEPNPDA